MDILPNDMLIKIIENVKINDVLKLCNSDKKLYAICRNNQDALYKIISKIPIQASSPQKFYKYVKGLDYLEIIKFITDNNIVNTKGIAKPDHIFSGNFSLNVLKFLLANGLSMTNTVLNNSLNRLSLPSIKFLIEDKKLKINNYTIQDVSYSKVKYLAEKGFLPHKEDIKLVKLNSSGDKKKIIDFLKEEFKKRS
jgi:hypothetical protein